MKKNYFLFFVTFFTVITVNAQLVEDNFEDYTIGNIGAQNLSIWGVWSGSQSPTVESIGVSEDHKTLFFV